MARLAFFCVSIIVFFPKLYSQSGCTDPCATNYDPIAITDDGSCTYATATLGTLPASLSEISGMVFTDGEMWVHGDGGSGNSFYRMDTTSWTINKTVVVRNANNSGTGSVHTLEDWEDITASASHFFIADVGNNNGNRENLKILRIAKADLSSAVIDSVWADTLAITYSDQGNPPFLSAAQNNNFDCEAILHHGGQLHLFSKNWLDIQTRHYALADTPGTHIAQLQSTYPANALITGADLAPNGAIALIGNNTNIANPRVLLFYLHSYTGNQFFTGHIQQMDLGASLSLGQVEGVAFSTASRLFFSSEAVSLAFPPVNIPQRAYGLHVCPPVNLPLVELAMQVSQKGGESRVQWLHPQGLNIDYFTLKRRMGESMWEDLARIEANEMQYDYLTSLPLGLLTSLEFQLLAYDFQGNRVASDRQRFFPKGGTNWFTLFPNPSHGMLWIQSGRAATVFLVNTLGNSQVLCEFKRAGTINISLQNTSPGYYQLRGMDLEGNQQIQSFILFP